MGRQQDHKLQQMEDISNFIQEIYCKNYRNITFPVFNLSIFQRSPLRCEIGVIS